MRRVIAEIEDCTDKAWGYHCPRCRVYLCDESPEATSREIICADCGMAFTVAYAQSD